MTERLQDTRLAIGFGCSSHAGSEELVQLIRASIDPIPRNTRLATLDRRELLGRVVASMLGLELLLFSAETLAGVEGTLAASPLVLERTGTASVAEAAALASLGSNAQLVVPQRKSRRCTCAVAAAALEVRD